MANDKSKKARNIRVIKDAENPETPEILAASIIRISEGFKAMKRDGLTDEALIALLKGMKGMSHVKQDDIALVLENLPKLSSYYIKK